MKGTAMPETIVHPFDPVYDADSEILILGSLPSVKSRQTQFYYGHPQNRFWKVLAAIFQEPVPATVEEKRRFLLRHHIALWDVISQCVIEGSSDASIRDVVPADLDVVMHHSKISRILCNGQTALKYYRKYQEKQTGIKALGLPSTSPANAAWSLERLTDSWQQAVLPMDAGADTKKEVQ